MSKASRIQTVIHIGLRQPEVEIINKIEEEGLSVSEVVRTLLKDYADKKWSGWDLAKPQDVERILNAISLYWNKDLITQGNPKQLYQQELAQAILNHLKGGSNKNESQIN